MELVDLLRAVQNMPFLVFALIIWKQERDARTCAEERERETLLKVAGLDK